MIHFELSAPSRLSLFGEYVVEHGGSGIMGSLNLRTTLRFTELPFEERSIKIEFAQINLLLRIYLREFQHLNNLFLLDENRLHEQVLKFVTSKGYLLETDRKIILQVFFYLFVYIAHKKQFDITRSFNVHLSTELIIDENSVCLPSVTVCLTAYFIQWSNELNNDSSRLNHDDFVEIVSYAKRCKEISVEFDLVNVNVCTYGPVIAHRSTKNEQGIVITNMTSIYNVPSVKILIVDLKRTQDLNVQTQQITDLLNRFPVFANSIFNDFDFVTKKATNALVERGRIHTNNELDDDMKYILGLSQHYILGHLIPLNQSFLHLLNLQSPFLNQICTMAQANELYGKYTDIGKYGRYAYVWCPPNTPTGRIDDFSNELKIYDFDMIETTLSCDGLRFEDD